MTTQPTTSGHSVTFNGKTYTVLHTTQHGETNDLNWNGEPITTTDDLRAFVRELWAHGFYGEEDCNMLLSQIVDIEEAQADATRDLFAALDGDDAVIEYEIADDMITVLTKDSDKPSPAIDLLVKRYGSTPPSSDGTTCRWTWTLA